MEKAIAEALASKLLEGGIDQYGNPIPSPLSKAMSKYAEDNKEKIEQMVLKNIQQTDFIDKLSNKIFEVLTKTGSTWYPNRNKEALENMVYKIVAEKLAEKQLEELKNK